jgi:hypothetical protein
MRAVPIVPEIGGKARRYAREVKLIVACAHHFQDRGTNEL